MNLVSTVHLGANVYLWDGREQDRLLVECLAPTVREVRSREPGSRFWFDRFDARGPHLFALLTIPRPAQAAVSALLSARLERHLAGRPKTATLSPDDLAVRHRECRGKWLCEPDREDGIAADGSYRLFEHPIDGYPFHLAAGSGAAEDIWSLVDDLSLWTIDRLDQAAPAETAARWIAAVDDSLRELGVVAADYWAFHARTLVPSLERQLEADEAGVLVSLRQAMAHPSARALVQAWTGERGAAVWPHVDRLVGAAVGEPSWPRERRWTVLYSLNHTTMKQLGLRVSHQIPLVFAAWGRSLSSTAGPGHEG